MVSLLSLSECLCTLTYLSVSPLGLSECLYTLTYLSVSSIWLPEGLNTLTYPSVSPLGFPEGLYVFDVLVWFVDQFMEHDVSLTHTFLYLQELEGHPGTHLCQPSKRNKTIATLTDLCQPCNRNKDKSYTKLEHYKSGTTQQYAF